MLSIYPKSYSAIAIQQIEAAKKAVSEQPRVSRFEAIRQLRKIAALSSREKAPQYNEKR
jgi:hypothetical protein